MRNMKKSILPVFAIVAMLSNSFESLAAGELVATVVREKNGMASVKFAPSDSAEKITAYDENGMPLAKLNWAASFVFPVTEKALRASTKAGGIDLNSLLQGMGVLKTDGDLLVRAELPITIQDLDGRELPKGTDVFLKLDRLAKEGTIVPTNAWGGESMGPGGAANEFNTKLYDEGVIGAKKKKKASPKAPKQGFAHGVHGDGIVPMDDSNNGQFGGQFGDGKFLSSPVCYAGSRRTTSFSSGWGRRNSKRTRNGRWSSHFHDGVDLAVSEGTPVVAAAAGCINYSDIENNSRAAYGYNLKVDHGNGFVARYAHLGNYSPAIRAFVKTGGSQKFCFQRGEYLGNSGMTGNCTGPHLHLGLTKNGHSVNPKKFMISQSNSAVSQTCDELQASNALLTPGTSNTASAEYEATSASTTASDVRR